MPDPSFQNFREDLKLKARENRSNPTPAEKQFWYKFLKNDQTGYRFLRQKPILSFIIDFYCSKLKLGIEIDGHSHGNQSEYDKKRTKALNSIGIKILRYSNLDVLNNIEGLYDSLYKEIRVREKEVNTSPKPPSQKGA